MELFKLIFILFTLTLINQNACAQDKDFDFMTPRDIFNHESTSNISLRNNRGLPATVFGLYVRQYSYVNPGDTCDHATVMYSTTENKTAGSFVMPTSISAGKSVAIGSNYLYNMIYEAIYYLNIIVPSSPPGCALPGCTWGSDTTKYNWCIYLGALAPVSVTSGYTASVPPSTVAPSSSGLYNYDLVSSYVYLGPISCSDQTLTCRVSTQQTQSFS
jgi:hypothetical protein